MLPFSYWLHGVAERREPELVHLDEFIASRGTAIDIGANIGLFTYALARRFQRVYAFEINDELTRQISQYKSGNIELIHSGLSSEARVARFYVPVSHGIKMAGWGSLNRDNLPGAERLIEKEVKVAPLDDFEITGVDFVKIDVEGHELEVLRGAAKTIAASRPVILIELKKEHVEAAESWFGEMNYRHCRLEDFIGVKGHRSNHIFVPVELLGRFGLGA